MPRKKKVPQDAWTELMPPVPGEEEEPVEFMADEDSGGGNGPVGPKVIAKSIEQMADAAQKLMNSGLTKRAVVLLVWDSLPQFGRPSRSTIEAVLDAAAGLRRYVVRKPS